MAVLNIVVGVRITITPSVGSGFRTRPAAIKQSEQIGTTASESFRKKKNQKLCTCLRSTSGRPGPRYLVPGVSQTVRNEDDNNNTSNNDNNNSNTNNNNYRDYRYFARGDVQCAAKARKQILVFGESFAFVYTYYTHYKYVFAETVSAAHGEVG